MNKVKQESKKKTFKTKYNTTKADYYLKKDIKNILFNGYKDINPRPKYKDGTPAYTYSVNQVVRTYDLSRGEFPISTLRPVAWKSAIKEVFWIYQDATSSLDVLEKKYNIHWWNEWESQDKPKTIGQRYGATVSKYKLVKRLIEGLQKDPYGRRHIMDLWQEADFKETDGLMPCAFLTLWNVRNKGGKEYLDMTLIQRSGDMLTASGAGQVNEIQYAALQIMIARHCGYEAGVFTHFVQNEQIYDRHLEQALELLKRESIKCSPKLILNEEVKNFFKMKIKDFEMLDYPRDVIEKRNPQLKFDLGI
jgi:thymidylate synthase